VTAQESHTFWIASDVEATEASQVKAHLRRAGWRPATEPAARLRWQRRFEQTAEASAVADGQVVNRIPGLCVLRRRDLITWGIRRARARAGVPDTDSNVAGLLETFVMPDDEERWSLARMAAPSQAWVQRPRLTTTGAPEAHILATMFPERGPQWVVQPSMPARDDSMRPLLVRTLALVASIKPLIVYALGTALCGEGLYPDAVAGDVLARLAGEVLVGMRELLLRGLEERGQPPGRHFQVVGVAARLDADGRPWFLEVETSPLGCWHLPPEVTRDCLAAVTDAIDTVDPLGRVAPSEIGPFRRVVPAPTPHTTLSALALPRPADVALAHAVGEQLSCEESALEPAPGVRQWYLGTDLVLYTPHDGKLQVYNAVGSFVWAALADHLDVDDTATELAAARSEPLELVRERVRAILGEWIDAGALVRRTLTTSSPSAAGAPETPSLGLAPVRWNADRVYSCLGSSVLVRLPNRQLAAGVDTALAGLADPSPSQISAVVEVLGDSGMWRLSGTHQGPAWVRTAHQLPSAVRRSVFVAAARASEHPAFFGSALESDGSVAVVLGPADVRAPLVRAWVASGGRILADELIGLDADLVLRPALAGLGVRPMYQWIDGRPADSGTPGAPMVDESGFLVQFRFPALSTACRMPLPVKALVVGGGASEPAVGSLPAGQALVTLMTHRVLGGSGVPAQEAESILQWLATLTCSQIALDDARSAATAIRALLRGLHEE
jgi:hypothetical protein